MDVLTSSQMKRERKDFNADEIKVLEEAWECGMVSTNKSCKTKIDEVAVQLQTTRERIEIWIGNKRAKVKRQHGASTTSLHSMSRKKYNCGPNSYSLFLASQQRGNEDPRLYFKSAAGKWRGLTSEEKEKFAIESSKMRDSPLQYMDRKEIVKRKLKVISEAVDDLESVGYNFGGLGIDTNGGPVTFVSGAKALNFFSSNKLEEEYKAFFKADTSLKNCHCTKQEPVNKYSEHVEMRQKVRQKFNECWEKATGSSKLPYSVVKAKKLKIVLVGCSTVSFKEPSWYGKGDMRRILSSLKSFDIETPLEPVASPSYFESPSEAVVSEALRGIMMHEDKLVEEKSSTCVLEPENRLTEVLVENFNDLQHVMEKKNSRKRKVQNELMQLMTKKKCKEETKKDVTYDDHA